MKLPSGWIFMPKPKGKVSVVVEERDLITCAECRYSDFIGMPDGKCFCMKTTSVCDETDFCSKAEVIDDAEIY